MSYILEALRRAERERDTGKAPSVESLSRSASAAPPSRVPLNVWILAISTAVVAIAALTILLWPASHDRPAAVASTQPANPSTLETAAAAAPIAPVAPAAATEHDAVPPPPAAIEDRDAVDNLDELTGESANDTAVAPPATQDLAAAGTEPDSDAPAAGVPAAAAAVPPASNDVTDHGTIVVPAGVTVLRDMPASYREQFPVRALDVHVYDPDPAKRWVMIDARRYREGDTLASGPQIVQIIESGVIFDYQGAHVLLPVR
ncbi:general secretion pathway protein GspB [Solimonas terrae]|uniref:General secretion pathway protein GspB n=1 Tax=Solimonas terrae TaxID=1396819 RepID=A0A6M2BU03_9GAMM|nr:general secretion pathway protein GspB [Solimonas terrae]NGY05469.1 general secretion pathway protein GspB [Solimonas terrae]